MDDKMESAIEMLKRYSDPGVYGCNLFICNEEMTSKRRHLPFKTEQEYFEDIHNRIFANERRCVLVW